MRILHSRYLIGLVAFFFLIVSMLIFLIFSREYESEIDSGEIDIKKTIFHPNSIPSTTIEIGGEAGISIVDIFNISFENQSLNYTSVNLGFAGYSEAWLFSTDTEAEDAYFQVYREAQDIYSKFEILENLGEAAFMVTFPSSTINNFEGTNLTTESTVEADLVVFYQCNLLTVTMMKKNIADISSYTKQISRRIREDICSEVNSQT